MPCQTDRLKLCIKVLYSLLCAYVSILLLWHGFKVFKHYYISISSSPELWATGKPYRGECVSADGLEGFRGLWGLGDGHGVGGCRDTVCCLRCFCNEPFSLRQKWSSGGRHNTNSMQEWLLKAWGSRWDKSNHKKEKKKYLQLFKEEIPARTRCVLHQAQVKSWL